MIVVADSGPLHYLILLNQADLLSALYVDVLIPGAVIRELSSPGAPAEVAEWIANRPAWLRIVPVAAERLRLIPQRLGRGEREAIALAEACAANLLLMDDSEGRAEARIRNLRVTGTLGVLRVAAELRLIDVANVIARLRETNFYFDEDLIRSTFAAWLSG